jgi:hypothetical protein
VRSTDGRFPLPTTIRRNCQPDRARPCPIARCCVICKANRMRSRRSKSAMQNQQMSALEQLSVGARRRRRGRHPAVVTSIAAWSAVAPASRGATTSSSRRAFTRPTRRTSASPAPTDELDERDARSSAATRHRHRAAARRGRRPHPAKLRELDGAASATSRSRSAARAAPRARRCARSACSARAPHARGGRLERYVESDRQIPRGFAGGPLIDADGAVIGMNTRTLLRGADLAIPTVTLRASRRAAGPRRRPPRLPRRRRVPGAAPRPSSRSSPAARRAAR